MTAAGLLSRIHALGIRLTVQGDRIHYRAPKGAMTGDLKIAIVANRTAIVGALRSRTGWPTLPPGWTTGPIDPCVFCGRGTAAHDDQGIPRHPACVE